MLNVMSLQSVITEYFAGERHEMFLIFGGSAIVFALSAWLWIASRSGFSTALLVTALLGAIVFGSAAGSLLVRDQKLTQNLATQIAQGDARQVVESETARVDVIVSKYRYYRYAAAVLMVFALFALLFSNRGWMHGVAVGLLLLVIAQILIDFHSERRAHSYLDGLKVATH